MYRQVPPIALCAQTRWSRMPAVAFFDGLDARTLSTALHAAKSEDVISRDDVDILLCNLFTRSRQKHIEAAVGHSSKAAQQSTALRELHECIALHLGTIVGSLRHRGQKETEGIVCFDVLFPMLQPIFEHSSILDLSGLHTFVGTQTSVNVIETFGSKIRVADFSDTGIQPSSLQSMLSHMPNLEILLLKNVKGLAKVHAPFASFDTWKTSQQNLAEGLQLLTKLRVLDLRIPGLNVDEVRILAGPLSEQLQALHVHNEIDNNLQQAVACVSGLALQDVPALSVEELKAALHSLGLTCSTDSKADLAHKLMRLLERRRHDLALQRTVTEKSASEPLGWDATAGAVGNHRAQTFHAQQAKIRQFREMRDKQFRSVGLRRESAVDGPGISTSLCTPTCSRSLLSTYCSPILDKHVRAPFSAGTPAGSIGVVSPDTQGDTSVHSVCSVRSMDASTAMIAVPILECTLATTCSPTNLGRKRHHTSLSDIPLPKRPRSDSDSNGPRVLDDDVVQEPLSVLSTSPAGEIAGRKTVARNHEEAACSPVMSCSEQPSYKGINPCHLMESDDITSDRAMASSESGLKAWGTPRQSADSGTEYAVVTSNLSTRHPTRSDDTFTLSTGGRSSLLRLLQQLDVTCKRASHNAGTFIELLQCRYHLLRSGLLPVQAEVAREEDTASVKYHELLCQYRCIRDQLKKLHRLPQK